MTALTIPAAAVRVGDLWVWTVPGEIARDRQGIPLHKYGQSFVAPQEWAQWDKPCEPVKWCEFCQAEPRRICVLNKHRLIDAVRQPDCRDGRQVWELRTECPQPPSRDRAICSRCGRTRTSWDSPCKCPVTAPIVRFITTCDWGGCDRHSVRWRFDSDRGWLPVCDIHGSVPLGRATIQVVPVVHEDQFLPPECIQVCDDGVIWLFAGEYRNSALQLALDPLPVPGRDFAVVARVVS